MPNILLVEDDDALSEGIALALRAQGTVRCCPTLAEAREALGRAGFDLMILDINLPDGSGLALLRERPACPHGLGNRLPNHTRPPKNTPSKGLCCARGPLPCVRGCGILKSAATIFFSLYRGCNPDATDFSSKATPGWWRGRRCAGKLKAPNQPVYPGGYYEIRTFAHTADAGGGFPHARCR